jgi:hypothetical protein
MFDTCLTDVCVKLVRAQRSKQYPELICWYLTLNISDGKVGCGVIKSISRGLRAAVSAVRNPS